MKTVMQKAKKHPLSLSKWGNGAKPKKDKINLAKPIQGQGEGSLIFAPDYDPCAPAFPESDWKS